MALANSNSPNFLQKRFLTLPPSIPRNGRYAPHPTFAWAAATWRRARRGPSTSVVFSTSPSRCDSFYASLRHINASLRHINASLHHLKASLTLRTNKQEFRRHDIQHNDTQQNRLNLDVQLK
jgi:hypothetical protein